MRLADYIVNRLLQEGIFHLFLVTGRGLLYLSDAVAKNPDVTGISTHHEQAAAFAAMAYAQSSNNFGACFVSTGCASSNAITGVLCAWQDQIPCIVISGQNTLRDTVRHTGLGIRTFGQQETDIVAMIKSITKYAVMIERPEDVRRELEKAIYLAKECPKGPVWIDVPLDIQNMPIEPDALPEYTPRNKHLTVKLEDVDMIYQHLKRAKRPALLIGSGIRASSAESELNLFLEKFQLPVACTHTAVDILDAGYPLFMGVAGTLACNRAANFTVQNADMLLVVGSRLTSMTVGNMPEKFARQAKVFVVDINQREIQKNTINSCVFVQSDAKDFFREIVNNSASIGHQDWRNKCLHWKEVFPRVETTFKTEGLIDLYHFADSLNNTLASNATIICDAGFEQLIIPTTIGYKINQRCLQPALQGAMGYALPAIIGAWFAGKKEIVVVVGDGSIMMNLQELQTIRHHAIPVKIFIINNNGYAVIRMRQQDIFRTRTIGTDPSNGVSYPQFADIARCFNFKYTQICESSNLEHKIQTVLKTDGAILCEVMAKTNQKIIHSSFTRTKSGKIVQRPIEDQSPFLERDFFIKEMLVEPIDL